MHQLAVSGGSNGSWLNPGKPNTGRSKPVYPLTSPMSAFASSGHGVCSIAFGYLSLEGLACLFRFAFLAFSLPGGVVGNDVFAFLSLSGIAGGGLLARNGGWVSSPCWPPTAIPRRPRHPALPGGQLRPLRMRAACSCK